MDKRYQVFISSTFADLREARGNVIQTVMQLDCIPAGMELFPAIDDEQWVFIQKVIDDCDYYVLLVGARYGSTDGEGRSFTEKEYDYAVARGLPVLAFLHEDPRRLRDEDADSEDETAFESLLNFRERVAAGRLVKFWTNPSDLPGLVALSLAKTLKIYPAVGWIRASQAPSTEILQEINELRKQKERLEAELARMQNAEIPELPDLAGLDDLLEVRGTSKRDARYPSKPWKIETTIRDAFAALAPYVIEFANDAAVQIRFKQFAFSRSGQRGFSVTIEDQDFQTLKIQLIAMRLVRVEYKKTTKGGMAHFWSLTPKGRRLMFELRAVRKAKGPGDSE